MISTTETPGGISINVLHGMFFIVPLPFLLAASTITQNLQNFFLLERFPSIITAFTLIFFLLYILLFRFALPLLTLTPLPYALFQQNNLIPLLFLLVLKVVYKLQFIRSLLVHRLPAGLNLILPLKIFFPLFFLLPLRVTRVSFTVTGSIRLTF